MRCRKKAWVLLRTIHWSIWLIKIHVSFSDTATENMSANLVWVLPLEVTPILSQPLPPPTSATTTATERDNKAQITGLVFTLSNFTRDQFLLLAPCYFLSFLKSLLLHPRQYLGFKLRNTNTHALNRCLLLMLSCFSHVWLCVVP